MTTFSDFLGRAHHKYVFLRRLNALARVIAPKLTPGRVLDVGAGNGMIGARLMEIRNDIDVVGIDVHMRDDASIRITKYDGKTIPFDDNSFTSVIIVDVLHHTDDYEAVLQECLRVSPGNVIIKDHFFSNFIELGTLKFLDLVGNRPHGVRLPYNYFTRKKWAKSLATLNAEEKCRDEGIPGLYIQPFQLFLGNRIQFLSQVRRKP